MDTPTEQPVQNQSSDQSSPIPLRRAVTTRKRRKKGDILVDKSKMDLFLEEYIKTNGNGTEAALRVFDCKSRNTAAVLARTYLLRARDKGRIVLEEKGITYGKLIDIAYQKAQTGKTPEWWDRLMKIGGYEDFMSKGPVTKATVNVMQVQKDLLDTYVEGEFVPDEDDI